jgi:predicted RNA-binding Zn-ribbon protein involved in translation (DUF1610 family)
MVEDPINEIFVSDLDLIHGDSIKIQRDINKKLNPQCGEIVIRYRDFRRLGSIFKKENRK